MENQFGKLCKEKCTIHMIKNVKIPLLWRSERALYKSKEVGQFYTY